MRNKSKYATKRESGTMMYGPGCCGHKLTNGQIEDAKRAAHERGHFTPKTTPFTGNNRRRFQEDQNYGHW